MSDQVVLNVDQVAAQIFSVERTVQPPVSENLGFEARLANPERNPFRGWNPEPRSIRSYQLLDVVLDGEFRGLFNAEGFIRGTGYLVPDEVMQKHSVDPARLVPPGNDANVIVGCNIAHNNYFHWITQALPAIDHAVNRVGQAEKMRVALPTLNAWQEESLHLLDLATVRRVIVDDPKKQYGLVRAEYSELLNGGSAFSHSATTQRTYERLRQSVERPAAYDRKIFVARTDASSRRMRNEDAIIEAVRQRGFDIVTPGSMSLVEQIRLFRGAGLVVGTHGAGMTNIVFCEPGTLVYELLPAHYPNACYCNLATISRLRYWADAFASEGEGPPHLREWQSDTALVIERIDELDAIHAQLQAEAQQRTIGAMDFLRGLPGQVVPLAPVLPEAPAARPGLLRRMLRAIFRR